MYCQTRISESTRIGEAPGRGPSLAVTAPSIAGLSASPGQGPVHSQTALDRGRLGRPGNRAARFRHARYIRGQSAARHTAPRHDLRIRADFSSGLPGCPRQRRLLTQSSAGCRRPCGGYGHARLAST